LSRT
jgi:hypothetical protein